MQTCRFNRSNMVSAWRNDSMSPSSLEFPWSSMTHRPLPCAHSHPKCSEAYNKKIKWKTSCSEERCLENVLHLFLTRIHQTTDTWDSILTPSYPSPCRLQWSPARNSHLWNLQMCVICSRCWVSVTCFLSFYNHFWLLSGLLVVLVSCTWGTVSIFSPGY